MHVSQSHSGSRNMTSRLTKQTGVQTTPTTREICSGKGPYLLMDIVPKPMNPLLSQRNVNQDRTHSNQGRCGRILSGGLYSNALPLSNHNRELVVCRPA